jgi:hypothetical protein
MRSLLVTGVVLALAAGGAMAQSPPAQNGPQNSAINKSDSTNRQVTAPVQGHNSFTEGEAKSRIEKQGFTNVGQLSKDADGVWRGQAALPVRHRQTALSACSVAFSEVARPRSAIAAPSLTQLVDRIVAKKPSFATSWMPAAARRSDRPWNHPPPAFVLILTEA